MWWLATSESVCKHIYRKSLSQKAFNYILPLKHSTSGTQIALVRCINYQLSKENVLKLNLKLAFLVENEVKCPLASKWSHQSLKSFSWPVLVFNLSKVHCWSPGTAALALPRRGDPQGAFPGEPLQGSTDSCWVSLLASSTRSSWFAWGLETLVENNCLSNQLRVLGSQIAKEANPVCCNCLQRDVWYCRGWLA